MNDQVARHKTAMSRAALSRPVARALRDAVVTSTTSVFDYGCGKGDDIRNLTALGYTVDGWDPTHRPSASVQSADVVNLGYVVNVIEDPRERAETLRSAWALAEKALVVSSRLTWDARSLTGRPLGDGLVTRTGTFQKLYEQAELGRWIEDTLGTEAYAAAPGVYYVFREAADAQAFLAERVHTYRPRLRIDPHELFQANETVLEPLLSFMKVHGRAPRTGEIGPESESAIKDAVGSIARAQQLIRKVTDDDYWKQVAIHRRAELLVYIALSRFNGRPRFSQLGTTLAIDIRTHFGKYQDACIQADRMLLACGDPAIVLVNARSSSVGKQTPSALYVHRSALGELPPILQVYEGCARALSGTVEHANLVKLSVTEPQVSYLTYPEFDRNAHPTLASSVIVNLRKLTVDWRDYRQSPNPPVLHRKEEFLGADDARRDLYSRLTRSEMRAGLYARPELIGTICGWNTVLAESSVAIRGHRVVRTDS
ncbi:SAM-dependent methyltransferase [Mycobacterium intermedium]|uniref:SAM-dependent methyltransferase n=1 Tax=Mycobacterium intermedium TaxID=28445 RepID=A0A1E3SAG8_MYCIE|nr:DNA phosphorothioation-associated putative methyltransferase [Mycobacterium intermedium]MCV6967766.1 DNA phosphorothioation-associated putative methyltransferase [Mycobacterium intermedium]ODQ99150.1 SAM-dependent methyltransferase [Mycobacterium intermedium]OPE50545.1 SAM-dependent methyltransferase [Mycobacterium intermedium]ORB05490.1 SAM-dependent methyltransferase [Mycobacterium intermedium]